MLDEILVMEIRVGSRTKRTSLFFSPIEMSISKLCKGLKHALLRRISLYARASMSTATPKHSLLKKKDVIVSDVVRSGRKAHSMGFDVAGALGTR